MKKLIFTLSLLLFGISAHSQLLWKISGNGIQRPSYIFGTHHVAPTSVLDSVVGFNEALASVDKVYGEMDMASAQSPHGQQVLMFAAMAPADSTLTTLFSPTQIDSINTVLRQYMGATADVRQFTPLKPAMVSTILALAQAQVHFPNFNPAEQIDATIQRRGLEAGKEVGGLETIEQQAAILFGSSILEQAEELMNTVRMDSKALELSKKLVEAYLDGDLNKMLELIEDPELGAGDGSERILNRRNADWVRVIAGLIPSASVLIAVGAGHLPGDKGLISLLRAKGYDVTPVEK